MGLLPMLDEEGRIVGGTDEGFLNKIRKTHKENKRLKWKGPERGQRTELNEFWIHHYADHVKYTVDGFVDKNRDILQNDLKELMENSNNSFISRTLFPPAPEDGATDASGETKHGGRSQTSSKKQKTQGGMFFEQLKSLLGKLNSSTPHFIRCIKPNNLKVGRVFSAGMCNRQLACSGVYEAVRIRQQGYPHRFKHHEFIQRYWTVAPHIVRGFDYSKKSNHVSELARPFSQSIVDVLEQRVDGFAASGEDDSESESITGCLVGRTRVLIPETHFTWLEQYRTVIQARAIYEISRVARGFVARSFCRSLTKSRKLLRAAIAAGDVSSAQELLQRVKRRTGKRVGFLWEQQQIKQLVGQHRQRQKLKVLMEAANTKGSKQGQVSHLWEAREQLIEAHDFLTDPITGLASGGTISESDRDLLQSAQRAVGIVEEMTQATAALMKAMEEPTVAGLSRAIAQGTNMQQLHGTYCAETMQLASGVLAETTAAQMANRASSPRRAAAPPLPARRAPAPALPTRKEQAAAVGVAPETYQRQMEALSAVGTMSMGIKNSWGRMTDDAKLKKLLLIEGLCESLRSSIFEGDYRTWAQERLGMSLLMFFFF
jgi:hypothetical protein